MVILPHDAILKQTDWDIIPKVICVLKPFADLTNFGSDETACISQIIHFVKYLNYRLIMLKPKASCIYKEK